MVRQLIFFAFGFEIQKRESLLKGFCNRKEQVYNNKKNYLYYNLKIRQIY